MLILETERLRIEEAVQEDASFFYTLLNSPTWIEHIGDRGIRNLDDARNYIRESLMKSQERHGFALYKMILKSNSTTIGICGLLQRDYLDHPDIGFAILPDYERQGYTFEAAKAVLEYTQSYLQLHTIYAITSPLNVGSQQLLTKLGMSHIQTILNSKDELFLFCMDLHR